MQTDLIGSSIMTSSGETGVVRGIVYDPELVFKWVVLIEKPDGHLESLNHTLISISRPTPT